MTLEKFNSLTPSKQSSYWPRCRTCKHIAQSHDTHKSESKSNSCCEVHRGQCELCKTWLVNVRCDCTGYDGPKDVNELIDYISEMERIIS